MNEFLPELLQPGQHLSPDQLSAFTENVLPEHERLAALTHLSACADCRQVVFLAQQADPAPIVATAAEAPRRRWFSMPQIFGAATAALACSLILALIVHLHSGQNQPAPPITTSKVETPTLPAPASAPVPTTPSQNKPASLPATGRPTVTVRSTVYDAEGSRLELAPQPPAQVQMASPSAALGMVGSGRATGMSSEAKAAAPKAQDKQYFADGSAASASTFDALAPQKAPVTINGAKLMPPAPPPPATQMEARIREGYTAGAAPAPASSADVNAMAETIDTSTVQDLPLNSRNATTLATLRPGVAQPFKLPSKKAVASVLNAAGRTLALDSDGALFISKDRGKHWTAVNTQWSGKAIQLSFAATPARLYLAQPAQNQTQSQMNNSNSGAAMATGVPQQQAPVPTAGFELTTATGAVWISTDGLTWRPR